MKKKAKLWIAAVAVFIVAAGAMSYQMLRVEWIDVGAMVTYLESQEPEGIKKIPYRFYNFNHKGEVIPSNADMADLELATSSGRARGKQVMIGVYGCHTPQARNGWPTVFCWVVSSGSVYISGDEKIRSQLMHLGQRQVGSLVGIVVGEYGGSPIIKTL